MNIAWRMSAIKAASILLVLMAMLVHAGQRLYPVTHGESSELTDFISRPEVDWVDPFIGTAEGRWFFFAPGAVPWGMVKIAPMTRGWGGYEGGGTASGYGYFDKNIIGFSHIHEFQLGGFLVMPTAKPLDWSIKLSSNARRPNFSSRYEKETERATPGYYSVNLTDNLVRAEFTATKRTGLHRYQFQPDHPRTLILDFGTSVGEGGVYPSRNFLNASFESPQEIAGSITIRPSYLEREVKVFFYVKLDKPFTSFGSYKDGESISDILKVDQQGGGLYISWPPGHEQIEMQLSYSFVDVKGAKNNLDKEVGNRSFEEIQQEARNEWSLALQKIKVSGGRLDDFKKFYTAMWHVLLGRGVSSDYDGRYLDANGVINQIPLSSDTGWPLYDHHNSDSSWGAFHGLSALLAMIFPDEMSGMVNTKLDIYRASGWLPDGNAADQFALGMPPNHSPSFIATAFHAGITSFEPTIAFDAIKKSQSRYEGRPKGSGNEFLNEYIDFGYIPAEFPAYGSASQSLDYAFSDACVAGMAKALGKESDFQYFSLRSKNYLNSLNLDTKYFQPRSITGDFDPRFSPDSGSGFAEGNAHQYAFFVPHDFDEYASVIGKELLVQRAEAVLREAENKNFVAARNNTEGYEHQYNHGNQPGLALTHLLTALGRADLTHYWVNRILDEFYGVTPSLGYGHSQDEDQGQLSSWFIMSSIGLFDIEGGCSQNPSYQISIPRFETIVIDPTGSGGFDRGVITMRRQTVKAGSLNKVSVTFRDEPLPGPSVPLRSLLSGGNLQVFVEDLYQKPY